MENVSKFKSVLASWFHGCLVSWFLGFSAARFQNFKVPKIQSFKFSNKLMFWGWYRSHINKMRFRVFWKVLISYSRFQEFIKRIVGFFGTRLPPNVKPFYFQKNWTPHIIFPKNDSSSRTIWGILVSPKINMVLGVMDASANPQIMERWVFGLPHNESEKLLVRNEAG